MPDVLGFVLVALIAAAIGFAAAMLLRRVVATAYEQTTRGSADRLLRDARAKQKEIILEAKDEALKIHQAAEKETSERRADVQRHERRLEQKEQSLDAKLEGADRRERGLIDRETGLEAERRKIVEIQEQQKAELMRVAGLDKDEARDILLRNLEDEMRDELNRRVRQLESQAREEADQKARDVILLAIQRYAAEHTAESTVSVVQLPSDDMKGRIIGREGRNIRTLEQLTGVDLIVDDTPEAVVVSGFDPVRREVAKLALERLLVDGRIHPARIEEAVARAKNDIEQNIKEAGEQAAVETGVSGIHPDLVKLLGRLKFRTSYGQNVLRHSVEVAHLAGMIASEIGADVRSMKRAGLLHDIGKAVDHEVEGPHTIIGGDLLKRYGFPQKELNGVLGHHGDVEPVTFEGSLISAADAISASRPGARSEIVSNYLQRLRELEEVANQFEGVEKSFAIQAGREIRVIVKPERLDDLAAARLARDVAAKIQETLQYPGQIKVTVIRETRAVDYAK